MSRFLVAHLKCEQQKPRKYQEETFTIRWGDLSLNWGGLKRSDEETRRPNGYYIAACSLLNIGQNVVVSLNKAHQHDLVEQGKLKFDR